MVGRSAGFIATIVAALVFGALPCASAWAVELPEFTTETTFTGTSGKSTFESIKGTKMTCKSASTEGSPTNAKEGTFHAVFAGCEEPAFKLTCAGLAEKAGTVSIPGTYRLVRLKGGKAADLLTDEEVHVTCGGLLLFKMKGPTLASIAPLGSKTTKYELQVKETKGKQELTEYENDEGAAVGKIVPLVSVNEGAFEEAGVEAAEDKITTAKETEVRLVPPAPKAEQIDFKDNIAILVDHRQNKVPESAVAIDGVGEKNKVEWQLSTTAGFTKNWPVVYVKLGKPTLTARFTLEKATEEFIALRLEGNATVTGEVPLNGTTIKFTALVTKAELEANKGFFITPEVASENALPNRVLYERSTITWRWKVKEAGQPAFEQELGKTTHNFYLVAATPLREPFLTLLDLATQGIQAEALQPPSTAEIIKGVMSEFKTKKIGLRWYELEPGTLRRGGTVMRYWYLLNTLRALGNRSKEIEEAEAAEQSTEEKEDRKEEEEACALTDSPAHVAYLLRHAQGRCNHWAFALSYALAAEGVKSEVLELGTEYGAGEPCAAYKSCFMLVKNWKFEGEGTSGNPTFPYTGAEVIDADGVEAQGVKNPVSAFYNHFIVEAPKGSGELYDPSYGTGPFSGANALKEFQTSSLSAFCVPGTETKCQRETATLRLKSLGYAAIE